MIKRLMGLSLLCLAFEAHASISVTTTADENNTNTNACSLREAIAMTNSADASKGIGGCTNSDATSTIILAAKTTYTLNSQLLVQKPVTLQSTVTGDINYAAGLSNPIIQAVGNHRAFCIVNTPNTNECKTDDTPIAASTTPVTMSLSDIDLQGCGSAVICDTKGGIIYNQGQLTLKSSRIYNGSAALGGAIYNQNVGKFIATTTEFHDNTAQQGAAVYSVSPAFSIIQSVVRKNTATPNSGFAIYTEISDPKAATTSAGIIDSTIYNNNANAANLVSGIGIQNATIVQNTGGITLNAAVKGILNNSIIALNGAADCTFVAGDKTPITNTIFTNGCDASGMLGAIIDADGKVSNDPSDNSRKLSNLGSEQVMAAGAEGSVCPLALASNQGLLCPFRIPAGQFNGYLLPRLLMSYKTLSESPIVNKGNTSCSSTDQRGQTRTLCDIGAIELVIPTGNAQTNGQDIVYGQTATMDLSSIIGDGQLIPHDSCASLYPGLSPATPDGQWLDGCARYSTAPAKGTVKFSAENSNMIYTPSSDYHGTDVFVFNLTTTTSYFSEAANNKIITVTTKIVQSPPSGIESKTVGGGGSLGIFGLFALMGLAMRRRLTGGQL